MKLHIDIINEQKCILTGLTKDDTDTLYQHFTATVEGYLYHPLYKIGRWDGKARYFTKQGLMYVSMLEEALSLIDVSKYDVTFTDNRFQFNNRHQRPEYINKDFFSHVLHPYTQQPTELFDHQVRVVNSCIEHSNGIIEAATGAGKTIICATIVMSYHMKGYKSITIVPDLGLINQTLQTYKDFGIEALPYDGNHKDMNARHIVSTWQSLSKVPERLADFDLIIVDECHGLKGNVLFSMLEKYAVNVPFRFGLTGTVPKGHKDKLDAIAVTGQVIERVPAKELIDKGILSNLHIHCIGLQEVSDKEYDDYCSAAKARGITPKKAAQYKRDLFTDFNAEKRFLINNEKRWQWIASFISDMMKQTENNNTLILVNNIDTTKKLRKLIPNCVSLSGAEQSAEERQQTYDLFENNNDLVVAATYKVASTGISIRRIFNVVLIDVGLSHVKVIQSIGRGLRVASDKNFVNVFDIYSNVGMGGLKHVNERLKFYKEAEYPYENVIVDYKEKGELFE